MAKQQRVLIFRLGSLGDTVVALPAFHLIARAFPNAERRVLTNFPISRKAAPIAAVLGESGLVHGYFRYAVDDHRRAALATLRHEIAAWQPGVCVYLLEPRSLLHVVRDALFLWSCGRPKLIGIPVAPSLRRHLPIDGGAHYESEAARLVRCLSALGHISLDDLSSWDLGFTPAERGNANEHLAGWPGAGKFIAISLGSKVDVKDWGETNWKTILAALTQRLPGWGLVTVGANDDIERSDRVAAVWAGPTLNLCGRLPPRVSALVIGASRLFVGHDSGPMHLAAVAGTPVVAIFSARSLPGVWYPFGLHVDVIYHRTPCFNCQLSVCTQYDKMCITSITPDEVVAACERQLRVRPGAAD
ncbi:MAG: glycosyltransferase family 9 protein [Rhodospirillales bacterium]|nr:glycosyltransferase family 9 protein [Rhodospirillales bacterium]